MKPPPDPHYRHRVPACCNELRLPSIARLWLRFTERADKEGWPAARFLSAVAELEIAEHGQRRIGRNLAEAHLLPGKTPDNFDFSVMPMLSKPRVTALAAGVTWLDEATNLLLFGPAVRRRRVALATRGTRSASRSPSQSGGKVIGYDRSEGGIVAPDELMEVTVENACSGLEQQMGTARAPTHRLALLNPFVDDLVDRGLYETG